MIVIVMLVVFTVNGGGGGGGDSSNGICGCFSGDCNGSSSDGSSTLSV